MSLQAKLHPLLCYSHHISCRLWGGAPRCSPLTRADRKMRRPAVPCNSSATPRQALFPRNGRPTCRHLAGGGASGVGGCVRSRNATGCGASWKCARQLVGWGEGVGGHYLSLYLTVISTLGIVHKTAGYSFPLLPSALQGGLQCGWGGGSDNSQHVYTGPKKKKEKESEAHTSTLGILWRFARG